MNKAPCRECKYRTLECHNICESYLEYRKVIDKAKRDRFKEIDATGYLVNNIYKFKKARNLPN